jgi:hypothetical protein
MNSAQDKAERLEEIEDEWWSSRLPPPSCYRTLAETSKWVCRLQQVSKNRATHWRLEVTTVSGIYTFSRCHTAVFMLLELQQLSSLSEAMTLPPGSSEIPRHLKNVNFLDQLRQKVLEGSKNSSENWDDVVYDPFLKRWIFRLIHGISNSKTLRKRDAEQLVEIYSTFEEKSCWKAGEKSFHSQRHAY